MTDFIPSLEHRIYQFLSGADYRPLKQHELAKALNLKNSSERQALRQVLRKLEQKGKITCIRKNRWALTQGNRHQVSGSLRVNAGRFGFVTPDEAGIEDLYIPEEGLGTALDGDRVLVQLSGSSISARNRNAPKALVGRSSGRIIRVLERRRTALVGLLCKSSWYWYVIPDNPRFIHTVRLRDIEASSPQESHKVRIQLDEWTDPRKALTGILVEDLGASDAPGVDILSIIRDHSLDIEFPEEVLRDASLFATAPPAAAMEGREDLRSRLIFTIDPADAKDFDDAVSVEKMEDNGYRLGVHIADVAYYVAPGTPLDQEAFLRGNSVYMVDRTIPMLPAHLTTEVCSLQAGRDRLTHSVEIVLDSRGSILRSRTFSSVIRSSARLTYDQVQRILDGKQDPDIPPDVLEALKPMRKLAGILRQRRMDDGSIELSMPEVRCLLNEEGVPVELVRRGADEAYNLIEEFMLAANCVVAGILAKSGRPAVYRIHPPPDARQWGQMQQELKGLGIPASVRSREALNDVARRTAETPSAHVAHLAILRNMKRAVYSPTLSEHFGLAFPCYTHFTSPIRRYPDLVVHRMLSAIERGLPSPVIHAEAARIAEHCSQTERNAQEAEEESLSVKRVEYYQRMLENRQTGPFEGLVTSLTPKGLIIELTDTFQRGLVPFRSMRDDHYVLDRDGMVVHGRRHRREWRIGQRISVILARVDSTRRLVDFYPVPDDDKKRLKKKHARKQKK